MAGNLTETEIKVYVGDLDGVRARLDAAGASMVKPRVFEANVRYENEEESLTRDGIVLRLRQDSRTRLTYKEPPPFDEGLPRDVLTRFEAEVTVDDFDTMDTILQRLGFHPYVIYEKYRTTYQLGAAEVVLDEMPYGCFIEVEGDAEAIAAALAALDMADAPRILGSYMALFDRVKVALKLDVHDLTFANFAGVDVPPGLFSEG